MKHGTPAVLGLAPLIHPSAGVRCKTRQSAAFVALDVSMHLEVKEKSGGLENECNSNPGSTLLGPSDLTQNRLCYEP